jgi:tripartite-type tricarboxylate transporter receptor subunit TctC
MSSLIKTLLAVLMLVSSGASAQGLAGKPLRLIVPFGPGGAMDIIARAFSTELGAELGVPAIVENRPGAGATIGAAAVAKAPPDGHTLLVASASHSINGALYSKLPYHPVKDFIGAAHFGHSTYILIINAEIPAKTVGEFIRFAKSHPGKLNYSSAGVGTVGHLSLAYLASLTELDMVHVPYKSSGDAANEVAAGRVQATVAASIGNLAKDARVRPLGITSLHRSKFYPDLPTLSESGLPGYEFDTWFGLLAPAGTPAETVQRINSAMAKVMKDPAVSERWTRLGVEARTLTPEAFGQLLQAESEKMAKVVRLTGAKVD